MAAIDLTESTQLLIPGLEIFEERLQACKRQTVELRREIGEILIDVLPKFAGHPDSVWVEWLKTQGLKLKYAEEAIAIAKTLPAGTGFLIPEAAIKMIAKSDPMTRQSIKEIVEEGNPLTTQQIKSIIKDVQTIKPGSSVFVVNDDVFPIEFNFKEPFVVESVDGDVLTVKQGGNVVNCFAADISLTPVIAEQKELDLPAIETKPRSLETKSYLRSKTTLLEDELKYLKSTLREIYEQDPNQREFILGRHPQVSTWEGE